MTRLTRVWFMRHGEVEAGYVGTFLGSTDVGLSDVGRHQSEAVGRFLSDADVDAVVTSPLRRARDTAAPTAKAFGVDPEVRAGLREMDFGEWETLRWEQIEESHPEVAAAWQTDSDRKTCPGGEDTQGFSERVMGALDDVLDEFAGRSVALFGHAGTNRAILGRLTGLPYLETFVFAQDYGCVNAAAWDRAEGFGQIALLNVVPGPRSEAHGDGGRQIEDA